MHRAVLVPALGVEPTRACAQRFLSPGRGVHARPSGATFVHRDSVSYAVSRRARTGPSPGARAPPRSSPAWLTTWAARAGLAAAAGALARPAGATSLSPRVSGPGRPATGAPPAGGRRARGRRRRRARPDPGCRVRAPGTGGPTRGLASPVAGDCGPTAPVGAREAPGATNRVGTHRTAKHRAVVPTAGLVEAPAMHRPHPGGCD